MPNSSKENTKENTRENTKQNIKQNSDKLSSLQGPMVTVIVPVYHSEDTLQDCVDSILATGEYENLELLLVANGLTQEDPALVLCRE
nr:glycosyltransferase [Lachnospiraceae bacterium]